MTGAVTEKSCAGRLFEGDTNDQLQLQRCQSGEASSVYRSLDQVENGTPSTSPPYWDSDDDDDGDLKPSDLYWKYTWKIEKYSQINKRELRSNAFEVGGYKWYILIYPQGCDVCDHLSLFLCVANHDKLLPGWSHFAQFTIAVINKEPAKSKFSDTLHRFCKKEHDWGWKKFMEISKVSDGFIDADTLIIKAQVQVIRERLERPFRCLDCRYRREILRIYLSNAEQIFSRFMEEHLNKLETLKQDETKWPSFCDFWLGMDQNSRRCLCREKAEIILKVIVKNFFIEKEVTSTLVMDSLYSGLRALQGQYKGNKSKEKDVEADELPVPIVRMEKEMFVLVGDVVAAIELFLLKDEKDHQDRTKDGTSGKDSTERHERRLTKLGRRTIEIFVLAHVFNKIEAAYLYAVSLKKQDELIREEEEEAWLAGTELRAKHGTVDKEKKSKKKQAKQKRNSRKSKDKGKDKSCSVAEDKIEHDIRIVKKKDTLPNASQALLEKLDTVEDASDMSDSGEYVPEILLLDSKDRNVSQVNWDADTSEMHPSAEAGSSGVNGVSNVQNGTEGRSSSVVDDSSSSCSSDSFPSIALSVPQNGQKNEKSSRKGRNHQTKLTNERAGWVKDTVHPSKVVVDTVHQVGGSQSCKAVKPLSQVARHSYVDRVVSGAECQMDKDEDAGSSRNCGTKGVDVDVSEDRVASLPRSPSKSIPSMVPRKSESKVNVAGEKSSSNKLSQADRSMRGENLTENAATSVSDAQKFATPRFTGKSTKHQLHEIEKPPIQPITTDKPTTISMPVISRPLSSPLIPGSVPAVSVVSVVPSAPILARSVSATGRLGLEPSDPFTQSYPPQSYRNAILGGATAGSLPPFTQNHPTSSVVNEPVSYSQAPSLVSAPLFPPHSPDWMDPNQINPNFSFEMMNHRDRLPNGPHWLESYQRESSWNLPDHRGSLLNGMQNFDLCSSMRPRPQDHLQSGISACTSGRQNPVLPDEFPHLDIINDLLDDEHGVGNLAISDHLGNQSFSNGVPYLNRHFSFPGEPGMSNELPTSSRRFERAWSYQDDIFQHGYGIPGAPNDALGNMIPQTSSLPYLMDGFIPNQWQMVGPDLPFRSAGTTETTVSPYHVAEYQNLTVDSNGYTVFRPSNGF